MHATPLSMVSGPPPRGTSWEQTKLPLPDQYSVEICSLQPARLILNKTPDMEMKNWHSYGK